MRMKKTAKILAAGCLISLTLVSGTPFAAYGQPALSISPREGIPVVAATASAYENVAISQVSNYVNVRTEPNTHSGIVGKIYNNCAAVIQSSVDGEGGTWYQIQSGTVNGYIKAEYFITGSEAEKIAKQVGTVYIRVGASTLRLREEPNLDSRTLTLLSENDEYVALRETGEFVEIQVDSDLSGYVHRDYVEQRVEFRQAVSLAEEQEQQEEAARLKKEADEAIALVNQLRKEAAGDSQSQTGGGGLSEGVGIIKENPGEDSGQTLDGSNDAGSQTARGAGSSESQEVKDAGDSDNRITDDARKNGSDGLLAGGSGGPGSEPGPGQTTEGGSVETGGQVSAGGPEGAELATATRTAIVAYAKQFLGNPYVYGGTSLTEGADCSGFVMRIFEHFGIEVGRSSRDQAQCGRAISLDELQPGDLLFYASGNYINHVAIYIGGGEVIHASTPKRGITISTAYYRTPCKAVTLFD